MSRLDANAKEWSPSAAYMGPLELPASSHAMPEYPTEDAAPAKPTYDALAPEFIPSYVRAAAEAPAVDMAMAGSGLPSYATLVAGMEGGEEIDWAAEFASVMELTGQLIHNQRFGEPEAVAAAANEVPAAPGQTAVSPAAAAATSEGDAMASKSASPAAKLSYAAIVSSSPAPRAAPPSAAATTTTTTTTAGAPSSSSNAHNGTSNKNSTTHMAAPHGKKGAQPSSSSLAPTSSPAAASVARSSAPSMFGGADGSVSEAGRPRHWKKQTKGQQRREMEQKNAFESFANALLHSVSPFMAPLRARCHTSLPHLKLDQRFGKSGQPQTAIAQFVVAPLITNYRPRHFHDVTPGDLMEFHYDLSQVLRVISSSKSLHIGYGPVWKRFAIPYLYLSCGQYRKEVLSLCPDEVPNSRAEALYEDDIVKDISEVVLSVEELKPLQTMSMRQAMKLRVNLAPLYDAFEAVFQPLENYMIEITDLDKVPSTFLLKTSKLEVEQKPQPIVLYGDDTLWYDLPVVSRVVQLGVGEVEGAGTSGLSAATTTSAAPLNATAPSDAPSSSPATTADTMSRGLAPVGSAAAAGAGAGAAAPNTAAGHAVARGDGEGINWMLIAPLALSACAVAATATLLVLKKK